MKYYKMIDNIDFNLEFFRTLFAETITDEWKNAKGKYGLRFADMHPVYVHKHKELQSIKNMIPNLGDHIKLIKIDENSTMPAHKDMNRTSAINIPAHNNSIDCVTNFLKDATPTEYIGNAKSNEYVQYYKNGTVEESYSLVDIPVLLNTTVPHEVINKGNVSRFAWTWAYNDSFENARTQLSNG